MVFKYAQNGYSDSRKVVHSNHFRELKPQFSSKIYSVLTQTLVFETKYPRFFFENQSNLFQIMK